MTEVIIGLDPHKASNTIAVLERDETLRLRQRFDNTDEGLVEMLDAVAGFGDRVWAGEGATGVGRSVAQRLVALDEAVLDIPAKLATRVRVYSTGHGAKTDRADAVAIARAAVHGTHLRLVKADDANVALKLLSDRRQELIGLRTQSVCRLHRLIRELVPGGTRRELTADRAYDLVTALDVDGPANVMRVKLARAMHIAAVVQVRYDTPGRAYYRRKLEQGKSKREALRCVKRRISDAVWRQLQPDREDDQTQDQTWPRWPSSRAGMPTYRSPDTLRRNGKPKKPQPATV